MKSGYTRRQLRPSSREMAPIFAFAFSAMVLGGCAASVGSDESVKTADASALFKSDPAAACASLAGLPASALGEPTARIISATFNPPTEQQVVPGAPPWMPPTPAIGEHCEVQGVMRERTGVDGQSYAVKFRLRLPPNWNERFYFEGGGGTNGTVGQAIGRAQGEGPHALARGFAVVSTDTGHDDAINANPARQGTVAFGHDYEARLEYAEKALNSVATTAKLIVAAHYGSQPRYNYFVGCSNGGREGMVFAQRFPNQFDGIVASAPAFAVPKAAIAEAWDTQVFGRLAESQGFVRPNGLPELSRTFTPVDFQLLSKAVAGVCDADDGVADGMIQRPQACTTARVRPALDALTCPDAKAATCLSKAQVEALVSSLSGPHNSKGEALYSDWPWDTGVGAPGWAMWKLGMPGAMDAINIALGSPALSGLFVTPPAVVSADPADSQRYQIGFDFDRDAPKIFETNEMYPRSGWDLVGAQSTDLRAFAGHGGKMIIPHGASDPIFSINDTISWWRQLDDVEKGNASTFARVFAVPGMNHCGQGPATDEFDSLGIIMDWVEKDAAPERIEAKAGRMSPWPGRTRPLCAFPTYARYRDGDLEKAESFTCEQP